MEKRSSRSICNLRIRKLRIVGSKFLGNFLWFLWTWEFHPPFKLRVRLSQTLLRSRSSATWADRIRRAAAAGACSSGRFFLKGPPLRVNLSNVRFDGFCSKYDPEQTRQGCPTTRLWNPKENVFQIDPLPWTLNFLSALFRHCAYILYCRRTGH